MNKNKIDSLFKEYYERLALFAESYVADIDTAEDIVQDVFVNLLSKKISPVEYNKSYLFSCVKNSCIDYLRKLNVNASSLEESFDAIYYLKDFEILEEEELISRIEKEIENLPEQRKNILKLFIYKNKSYSEIAELMDLSVNTVKTHMKKAYQDLRARFEDDKSNLILLFLID